MDLQTVKVKLQTVFDITSSFSIISIDFTFGRGANQATCEGCIKLEGRICLVKLLRHVGIVTTSHQFIIDNHLMSEVDGGLIRNSHTTHVTTAIERADIGGIIDIVGQTIFLIVDEYDTRHQWHGTTVHVLGESRLIRQVHRSEIAVCLIRIIFRCPTFRCQGL